jgi:hypothetical protein
MSDLSQIPRWAYPAAGALVVVALLAWAVLLWNKRRALQKIEQTIDSIAYDVLRNVLVPNGMDGHIFLQYLLLTERGLLVIDLLDRPGAIFGGDQMVEWTSIGKKQRYTFRNPQHALYDRLAAVKLLAANTPVDGRVVFTTRSEFPKGKSTYVTRIDELTSQFAVVDRNRGNVVAAFANVWTQVKKNAQQSVSA